jgi:hypothetical protein
LCLNVFTNHRENWVHRSRSLGRNFDVPLRPPIQHFNSCGSQFLFPFPANHFSLLWWTVFGLHHRDREFEPIIMGRNGLLWWANLSFNYDRRNRWRCLKWPDVKSDKIRSVASRSRCTMIISDKLFIHQLESKSLYSISHISETKPTRNDTCAAWIWVISMFEIPKCDGEKCYDYVLRYNDPRCAFWQ